MSPAVRRRAGGRLRGEIVGAATELLEETGTLSLRAVARRTGIATTSIYLHFDDLAAVRSAVQEHLLGQLIDAIESAARGADDPRGRVQAIARAYVARSRAELFSGEASPAVRDLGRRAYEVARRHVQEAVAGSADADLLTVQLWCALHGLAVVGRPGSDALVDDLVVRFLASAGVGSSLTGRRPRFR